MERMFAESGLEGRVALVTGGSRGIGRAIVERLAAEGARVAFLYRNDDAAARDLGEALSGAGVEVMAQKVDVRDDAACEAAVERLVEQWQAIDVLVNNAGVTRDNLLGLLADADVRMVLDTNVGGAFNVTRAVVPHMVHRRSGAIVNLSSVAAGKGGRGQTPYAASKGALEAFTRALAVELAPRGIRVNAVAPGVIDTELSAAVRERAGAQILERVLLRRVGTPAEVAQAVCFLASKWAAYVTGAVLHVDGGFKME